MIDLIRCPHCNDPLNVKVDKIICASCGEVGNFEQGVYHFTIQHVPNSKQPSIDLARDSKEWEQVVRHNYQQTGDLNWLNESVYPGNAAPCLLANFTQESIVLNLGCKLGKINEFLSYNSKLLLAIDYDHRVIANAQQNITNEVRHKIQFIVSDKNRKLPFSDNSIDLVYLNKPDDLYQLKEVFRVLKPDGQLLLIVQNKYSFHDFSALNGSSLKIFLSNLLPDIIRRKLSRTRNEYAQSTYELALAKAGFSQVQCNYIKEISNQIVGIQLSRPYIRPQKNISKSIKSYIKNHKGFQPWFCFVAMKQSSALKTLLNGIHSDTCNYLASPDLKFSNISITGKSKAVLIGCNDSANYIIKIPFEQSGVEGESHNNVTLQRLKKENILTLTYPLPLVKRKVSGCYYFIETMCPGEPLLTSIKQYGRDHYAESIFTAWKKLANYNKDNKKTIVDEHLFSQLIGDTGYKLKRLTNYESQLDRLVEALRQALVGTDISLGLVHGDFSVSNTFTSNGEVTGLIDWEVSDFSGVSIIDLINIYTSVERLTKPKSNIVNNIEDLLSGQWSNELEWQYLQEAKAMFNLSKNQFTVLIIAHWFGMMTQQIETDFIYDSVLIETRIDNFLRMVENKFNNGLIE